MQSCEKKILMLCLCGWFVFSGAMPTIQCLCAAMTEQSVVRIKAVNCDSEKCCHADTSKGEIPVPPVHNCVKFELEDYAIHVKSSLKISDYTQLFQIESGPVVFREILSSEDTSLSRENIHSPPPSDQSPIANKTLLLV